MSRIGNHLHLPTCRLADSPTRRLADYVAVTISRPTTSAAGAISRTLRSISDAKSTDLLYSLQG